MRNEELGMRNEELGMRNEELGWMKDTCVCLKMKQGCDNFAGDEE